MDTLKKHLIYSLYSLPTVESLEGNKLIVVTPAGVISGYPITNEETVNSLVYETSGIITSKYRKEHSLDDSVRLEGNDGYFILKDVTLNLGSYNYRFDVLNVFYDQVIAITVGKTE